MASPSAFNPAGTGPEGFVPNPGLHSPGQSAGQPTNQPTKGDIKSVPDDATKDTPYNDRFLQFVKEKWPSLRTAYTIYHQLVWQNLLYYVGQLWIQWDKNRRIYMPAEPEDEYTPQPEINYYAPAADAVCSVFTIPEVECVPKKSSNQDAHDVAEVANILCQEFMVRNGLKGSKDNEISVSDRASQLFVQAGNIFGFVRKRKRGTYDRPTFDTIPMMGVRCPQCDTASKVPPDDPMLQPPPASPGQILMGQQVNGPGITPGQPPFQPPCPACGQPLQTYPTTEQKQRTDPETGQPVMEQFIQWDAEFILGNPLYGLPRAGARSMKESKYILWAERLMIDEIYEKWQYEAQPDNQFLDAMESSWEIALNYYYTGFTNMTESTKDSALVIWAYIEPGKIKDVPEGGVGVLIGENLINIEPWDEATCNNAIAHPMSHACYLDVPVTFFARTPMFDVASHQRELNRYESIIALQGMTQASDSVVVDENTKVSEITGRGDRIVYWRSIGPGSQAPHRMQHGSLDTGIYEQRQSLKDNIQNVTGAVNVWRGQQAGSVTASGAISQLRGQAEQMFNKPTNNWNSFWAEQCRKGVKVMQHVMTLPDIIAILGDNNNVKAQKFKTAKLDDILDWKAGGHGLPRTRDERKEEMLTLFDRQLLDVSDPDVQENIHELFGDTGMKTMFNKDATRARWENSRMKEGHPVQFMPDVEDLNVHAFIHAEQIKELDFDTFAQPVQQMMLEHFMQTKMALTQQMAMQQAMQVSAAAESKGKTAPVGHEVSPNQPAAPPAPAPPIESGPGQPSNTGGPNSRGGTAKGRPGRAGGRIAQSAGQRRSNQPNGPTGPPQGGG